MDKKAFGQKLKQIRKLKHYTQEKLAEVIDIDMRQVVRLEAGESLPSLDTFVKICVALEVTPNDMLEFAPDNKLKSDIYDLISVIKPEQLELIKKLTLAVM
ncbi:helix-turn-helix transcriptional regulator [bacterium]|nr:helix-turn-helix transcriptional regulator [bacterium]